MSPDNMRPDVMSLDDVSHDIMSPGNMSPDIKSLTPDELRDLVVDLGEKPYRAEQLFSWMHARMAASYDEMGNLPKAFRETLAREYPLTVLRAGEVQISREDGTRKYLFVLPDGNCVESVLMKYHYGYSVCISSQVGCAMGCTFCASTIGGLKRNLLPSEMLEQIYRIQSDIQDHISHIVVMGMGEPLANYGHLLRFIRLAGEEKGLLIGQRNITVSTCGLVPQIDKLAEEHLQITLAISLHAPNDEIRKRLMPVARRYSMEELLAACRRYFAQTGRRLTFEYSMIRGVNDSMENADELARALKGINCHVNLIPVNPVRETAYQHPDKNVTQKFKNKLEKYGINVTIRREMGRDIDGACGQLRNNAERET